MVRHYYGVFGALVLLAVPASAQQTTLQSILGAAVPCTGGTAAIYPCGAVDLMAFLPTRDIGGGPGAGANDIWGWTDPETGREYALVGRTDGTAFVDVSDPVNPRYLGNLPTATNPSLWRDVKVYANHAFVVADAAGPHGVQVFDLTALRTVTNPPVTFAATTRYEGIASAHNIAINEASGFAYAVGANTGGETCGRGLHMIDIQNPTRPAFAGCFFDTSTGFAGTGYTHDVQCVLYHGPDADYQDREICFGANENALSIADVTDKQQPVAVSTGTYPDVGYAHQGWLTEDHRYFFLDDEVDEFRGIGRTRTLIWDLADLDDPQLLDEHEGVSTSSDHNQYIVGTYLFQSNYASGLRILDIADVTAPREVAFFDVYPADDDPSFSGSWSNYPFFRSGNIVVTGRDTGVFVVRPTSIQVGTDAEDVPAAFTLSPAYPNPFNPTTTLTLTVAEPQPVTVAVYDTRGRPVAVLHQGPLVAGTHRFAFAADDLPSATYFVRAEGIRTAHTQVVTLVR